MSLRTWVLAARSGADGRLLRMLGNGGRLVKARLRYGIHPFQFSLYGMASRPESEWPEFLTEAEFRGTAAAYSNSADRHLADDKVAFFEHCVAHGIATVPIEAIISDHPEYATHFLRLHDAEALSALILAKRLPLFFKRMQGGLGRGAFRVTGTDGALDFLGSTAGATDLFAYCRQRARGERGYLIQRIIEVHPVVQPLMSPHGVGTVRITTYDEGEGHRLLAAAARLTVGSNSTDNFAHGSSGNLACEVDLASGTVLRCTASRSRTWPDMVSIRRHPDTGAEILGFQWPDWNEAVELVLRAARTVPGLRIIGWDVAFTPGGAVIVEMNSRPNADILQVALQRGLRPDVRRLMEGRPLGGQRPAKNQAAAASPHSPAGG